MKILNLIWKFGTGGIAKCFETYTQLGNIDHNINILSVCIDPQNFNYDRNKLKELNVTCINIKNVHDFSWHSKLASIISQYQPDIIFTHGIYGPLVYLITKYIHKLNVPLICSFHGLYFAPTKNKKWIAPLLNKLSIMIYKYACQRIVAVSYYSQNELASLGVPKNKIFVVHNGIKSIPLCTNKKKEDTITIGLVSRLDPFKGIDILLEALLKVKKMTNTPFKVEILGDGPMQNKLQWFIDNNHLKEHVHLLGYQSNISEWMNKWDIFCLPSFFENHSVSILEAMRAGKAIVTTDVGGNKESVTDGKEALIVPAKDSESLAESLTNLINNSSLRQTLGENAHIRFLNEFTEDIMKKNLIKALTLK